MTTIKMGMRLALVAAAILSVSGIKVPVDETDENNTQIKTVEDTESEKPIYYESDDDKVDSYLIPPNSHYPSEDISDEIVTLATYLLPPSEDKQLNYYKPTEAGEQTDWYPIAPAISPLSRQLLPPREVDINPVSTQVNQSESTYGNFRNGKLLDGTVKHTPVLSRDLQPPLENAPNEYISSISNAEINIPFENERPIRPAGYPLRIWNGPILSVPNNIKANGSPKLPYNMKKHKNQNKLYPKKYSGSFRPVPIPINQFNEESLFKKAKPPTQFQQNQNVDHELRAPSEDKTILNIEELQNKRNVNGQSENVKIEEPQPSESNEDELSLEQDTSATNYRVPLRQAYPAPIRQAPKPQPSKNAQSHPPPADGDRTEFRMHGMKGPHSYQFGFDTGKGKNRQFRYEERDNDGRVKGHYGYMDKNGKLRVVNYDADPEHGFRAEPPVETE